MDSKQAYQEKMEARLKELSASIDVLKARAAGAAADAKITYQKKLDAVLSQRQAVRQKLDELAAAGEQEWAAFKSGVEAAWDTLRQRVDEVRKTG